MNHRPSRQTINATIAKNAEQDFIAKHAGKLADIKVPDYGVRYVDEPTIRDKDVLFAANLAPLQGIKWGYLDLAARINALPTNERAEEIHRLQDAAREAGLTFDTPYQAPSVVDEKPPVDKFLDRVLKRRSLDAEKAGTPSFPS